MKPMIAFTSYVTGGMILQPSGPKSGFQVVAGNLPTTLWLCQQFAIENDHRNSGFSH